MRKKQILISFLFLLIGTGLFTAYYFVYFRNIIIYDLVNIEYTGISKEENGIIKTIGNTPAGKKVPIRTLKNENQLSGGCFQSLELIIPDTLRPKITSVKINLKSNSYTFASNELIYNKLSDNTNICVLPPGVKSHGTLIQKLSSAFPFNLVFSSPLILRLCIIIFIVIAGLFIFICLIILIRWIKKIIPENKMQQINNVIHKRPFQYLFICISFLLLAMWPVLWPDHIKIIYFLLIILFILFLIKTLFRIKKSFALYIFNSIIIVFLCFELFFTILQSSDSTISDHFANNESSTIFDKITTWRARPDCFRNRHYKISGHDTIFDYYFTTDEYGRRISDQEFLNHIPVDCNLHKKHAVFLGCSYTHGTGLDYTSTFPFLFEQRYPDYKSYNFGVNGFGPNQICLLFDEGINIINDNSVAHDSGFCIYTFIIDHLNRVYGSSTCYSFNAGSPDVYVKDNKLIRKKRSEIIPWFLTNSATMTYFNIHTTYPKSEEFYKRYADIINYTAARYWKLKPAGEFYVGIYPCSKKNDTEWVKYLNKRIQVINPVPPADIETNPSYFISNWDIHPTNKLNDYYIEEISKSIIK